VVVGAGLKQLMKLVFTLSMPGCASWNGRWSGAGKLYAIVRGFNGKKGREKAQAILTKGYFSYGWSDGWRAGISVKEVTQSEVRQIRRTAQGFCGYDWMVDSIVNHGAIYASTDEIPKQEVAV
jgi:hypothetical protein